MKLANVRKVAELQVSTPNSSQDIALRFVNKLRSSTVHPLDWHDWTNHDANHHSLGLNPFIGFKASVVDYDSPARIGVGLDRRDALRILRKAGLRPPTHREIFALASEQIWLKELTPIIRGCEKSILVAPVSINKEFPFFYYFEVYGVKGTLCFKCRDYFPLGGYFSQDTNLVFGEMRNVRMMRMEFSNPLILGVDPESVNLKMITAKKAVQLGKSPHENEQCPHCEKKGAICLDTPGGHAMIMQCVSCNFSFEIDGE